MQNLQILAGDGRATLAGLLFFGKHPQMSLCKTTPIGISDMMRHTGYQSRTTFRRRLFTPLLDSGLLVPEFPGSINSPRQRYRSVFPV
ncbi:MAG: hypothetical protein J6Z41_03070 [Prevotella sp.]|nr:hypothetical protein [Prevotella sp.]